MFNRLSENILLFFVVAAVFLIMIMVADVIITSSIRKDIVPATPINSVMMGKCQ